MANIAKMKRDRMLAFLEQLKAEHSDDESIRAFNEIENHIREKKYGLIWEDHTEAVDEMLDENIPVFCEDPDRRLCKDPSLPFNFIIEGDNLQALYLLEKTHRGKVDCIYIDPPYNSGAKDWKYNNDYVDGNDAYRHSKWLSMMRVRLQIAKHLLNPSDSVLICTIDEKEFLRLGCLLEELFPDARIQMVSSVINPAGAGRQADFARTDEYIFFVQLGSSTILPESRDVENVPVIWDTLRRSSLANARGMHGKGACGPNQFYPIYVDDSTGRIREIGEPIGETVDRNTVPQIEGCTAVFPIRPDGTEMNWGIKPEEARDRLAGGYLRAGKHSPKAPQQYVISYVTGGNIKDIQAGIAIIDGYEDDGSVRAYYPKGRDKMPTTNWNRPTHDAQRYGTNLITPIIGRRFPYPKSLYAVRDAMRFFVANKPDAIIVDFFAGSGTTMHAVNLLNAEDCGCRKCIIVTNNEVSLAEAKSLTQKGYQPGDTEWEKYGIAQYVTWPRTICSINGVDVTGKPLKGEYITTNGKIVRMADGFNANVKYLKCEWTPRKPEDYLLSNALCLHIKEMIELQTGYEVDGERNVLILNRDDFKKVILDPAAYEQVENIWVNQNMIFGADEMKLLVAKGFKYIPREFFGRELREAAE